MKKTSTELFAALSNNQIANLSMEVKETIALQTELSAGRIFTAADLWNIQRRVNNRSFRKCF